jgi:hypothetical protein
MAIRVVTLSVLAGVTLAALTCCEKAPPSQAVIASPGPTPSAPPQSDPIVAKIVEYFAAQGLTTRHVSIVKRLASYRDARRSTYDTGTTTRLVARIEWADGSVDDRLIRMFVAESDGYTEFQSSTVSP